MTVMRDVTDQWNALEEKKKSEQALQQARKMESIGQLAAGLAHELNTPLQYVRDNISFLETAFFDLIAIAQFSKKLLKDSNSEHIPRDVVIEMERLLDDADLAYHEKEIPLAIGQSINGTDQMAKIIQSMKECSHQGKEATRTDINRTLENTITITRNEWKDHATITRDLDESLPRVYCNPGEISQVFLNMIINASQAIEKILDSPLDRKGTIHIKTRRTANWVQIHITDTGQGISKEDQDRIFDPFFTTKTVGKGTGQGLAISYAVIVDKHQGKIDFKSERKKGTTFIISLPV
jgi:signal transduction histidine kinase